MSLLMQALKKAERAKQNHEPEDELDKPSEAYDDLLALTPQDERDRRERIDPPAPLTLSPLDGDKAGGAEPEPVRPRLSEPTVDERPEPAQAALKRPRHGPPPPSPRARAQRRMLARMDARSIRIAVLSSIALMIAVLFAYMYWRAVYGPGSSRHLPMVPMPGLVQAPAAVVEAGFGGQAPLVPGTAPDASAYAPPPYTPVPAAPAAGPESVPNSRDRPDDHTRMEQEMLAAQQQARQAQQPRAQEASPAVAGRPAARAAPDNGIRVARASKPEQINPALQGGYNAYQAGDLVSARQQYQAVLRQDANNRDALLGMAAVAAREDQLEQAAATYARLLDLDPNDNDALAGLSSVRQGDPGQSEGRLRRMLDKHPESAPLLFSLGNLYARQGRWPEAQQHYFRAYSAAPGNADYAFNLGVGLDRLNQGKLARTYYQRALELAQQGTVSFDRAVAAARAQELGGQ